MSFIDKMDLILPISSLLGYLPSDIDPIKS